MSTCRHTEQTEACFTNAAGVPVSVTKNTVFNSTGSIHATYYSDAAGATIDTSVGTVVAGACQLPNPDVEWEQLCDVATDGTVTKFMCRSVTRFNPDGSVIDPVDVAMFEMDKVTPYVVAGEVGKCDTCPVEAPLGLITDTSVL